FGQDLNELPIVMLPRPLSGSPPCGLGAGTPAYGVQELFDTCGQLSMVVGIVNDVTIVWRTEELARPVIARSDHRQFTGKRLEHNQGTGIVKGRMNQAIRRKVPKQHDAA